MSEVEPRCPSCDISGIEHIVSRESQERSRSRQPWFHVIHCKQCGHVYNVLTKHVLPRQERHVSSYQNSLSTLQRVVTTVV